MICGIYAKHFLMLKEQTQFCVKHTLLKKWIEAPRLSERVIKSLYARADTVNELGSCFQFLDSRKGMAGTVNMTLTAHLHYHSFFC